MNLFDKGELNILNILTNNVVSILAVAGVIIAVGVVSIGTSYRNASNINSGTLADARLSSNIARLNNLQAVFSGQIAASNFAGNLTGNVVGNVNGNASTATALESKPSGCAAGAFANDIDRLANLICSTDGSSLNNLNGTNISSGTVADSHLSSNVAFLNALSNVFKGTVTATKFFGDVVGNFTGTVSGNAATATSLASTPNGCIGGLSGGFAYSIDKYANLICSSDGSNLTNLTGANVIGAVLNATNAVNANNISGGTITGENILNSTIQSTVTGDGSGLSFVDAATLQTHNAAFFQNAANISGNGSNITNVDALTLGGHSASYFLDAGDLTGTLQDIVLSSNVPLLNAANHFTTTNTFDNIVISDGTIDNTVIGGGGPAAGSFTDLSATGSLMAPTIDHTSTSCSPGMLGFDSGTFYGCTAPDTWTAL